tara:strand:+ start:37 stop:675 length:639 start_codon:yes stop_codon:yes gene_type:complete
MAKIISRKEALAKGLKRYFTGKKCIRGHIAVRSISRGVCVICRKIHQNKYELTTKGKINRKKANIKTNEFRQTDEGKKKLHAQYVAYYSTEEGRKIHIKNSTKQVNKRLKNDPVYRLLHNLRSRLYGYLKKKGENKYSSVKKDIGCTKKELKNHLEKTFLNGMTWRNYGKIWSVDHIKPISKFKFNRMHEANYYQNLQALFVKDNIRKGNKY